MKTKKPLIELSQNSMINILTHLGDLYVFNLLNVVHAPITIAVAEVVIGVVEAIGTVAHVQDSTPTILVVGVVLMVVAVVDEASPTIVVVAVVAFVAVTVAMEIHSETAMIEVVHTVVVEVVLIVVPVVATEVHLIMHHIENHIAETKSD